VRLSDAEYNACVTVFPRNEPLITSVHVPPPTHGAIYVAFMMVKSIMSARAPAAQKSPVSAIRNFILLDRSFGTALVFFGVSQALNITIPSLRGKISAVGERQPLSLRDLGKSSK
jgi:hypothetical protein